jgi:hypothetical protein
MNSGFCCSEAIELSLAYLNRYELCGMPFMNQNFGHFLRASYIFTRYKNYNNKRRSNPIKQTSFGNSNLAGRQIILLYVYSSKTKIGHLQYLFKFASSFFVCRSQV